MTDDMAIIDIKDALNRALGDVAFLQMMFDEFQQMIPEILTGMENAVCNGDMRQLAMDAHQFKGAAANLGAMAIASSALALEKIGKCGDPAGAHAALEQLKTAIAVFREHLAQIEWTTLSEE